MNRVVLVTGASSGIGSAVCEEYARRGARVALIARRTDRLEALAEKLGGPSRAIAVAADVSRDGDLERATKTVLDAFGRIDVVLANAGFSVNGTLERLTLADYQRQFDTNVFGVLRTVYATLDAVKETRGSYGLVGSVSGFVSVPGFTPYSMSKYAVRALAEGLALELARHSVSVTHIAPGFVDSEIRNIDRKGVYREDAKDPVPRWLVVRGAVAAKEIADALDARVPERVITGHGKVLASLSRHLPALMYGVMRAGRAFVPRLTE